MREPRSFSIISSLTPKFCARIEYPIGLVELVEGARIRIGQAHRAGDDRCQHRLESSDELTAWPTSFSACSSATKRISSRVRASTSEVRSATRCSSLALILLYLQLRPTQLLASSSAARRAGSRGRASADGPQLRRNSPAAMLWARSTAALSGSVTPVIML